MDDYANITEHTLRHKNGRILVQNEKNWAQAR